MTRLVLSAKGNHFGWEWESGVLYSGSKSASDNFNLIRRERIALVHTNTAVMPSPAFAAWLAGLPHVWHMREIFDEFRSAWKFYGRYVHAFSTRIPCVSEAIAAAQAAGVKLSMTNPEQAWTLAAAGLPAAFKTSMLQSLEKGTITEIDFINGSVVRCGQRYGVPTPVNATLVACVKGIERSMADQQRQHMETTA